MTTVTKVPAKSQSELLHGSFCETNSTLYHETTRPTTPMKTKLVPKNPSPLRSRMLLLCLALGILAPSLSSYAALLDIWDASTLTNTINPITSLVYTNADTVDQWLSSSNRNASSTINATFTIKAPTFSTNGTPSGKPVLNFFNALSRIADTYSVPLIAQRTNFSIAYIFRVDTNFPPTVNGNENWFNSTCIVDGEQGGTQYDWGTGIRTDGQLAFGIGGVANKSDDRTTKSQGASLSDGLFHIVVVTWGNGISRVYVDGRPVVVSPFNSTDPRRKNSSIDPADTSLDTAGDIVFGGQQPDAGSGGRRFRGDIAEIQFYDTNLPPTEVTNLISTLSTKHGLGVAFSPLAISSFAATPTVVVPGTNTLLQWTVTPGSTVLLYTNISAFGVSGNSTDLTPFTTGGAGSINLAPANDTLYTLVATNAGFSISSYVRVAVARTAQSSLIDVWVPATLTNDVIGADNAAIWTWTGTNGRVATYDNTIASAVQPSLVLNATPSNTPAVKFTKTKMRVPSTSSLGGGKNAFTVAYVFKLDSLNPPINNSGIWRSGAGVFDEFTGAGAGSLERSWGTGIRNFKSLTPEVAFGTRNPGFAAGNNLDITLNTFGSGIGDFNFHVVVASFGAGQARIFVDGLPKFVSFDPPWSTDPRDVKATAIGALQNATGSQQHFFGNLAEVRFYDANLTDYETTCVIKELAAKHGVPVTFPAPASFSVTSTGITGGKFALSWQSTPGTVYTVESRTNLTTGTWGGIANVTAMLPVTEYIDPSILAAQTYYRIKTK